MRLSRAKRAFQGSSIPPAKQYFVILDSFAAERYKQSRIKESLDRPKCLVPFQQRRFSQEWWYRTTASMGASAAFKEKSPCDTANNGTGSSRRASMRHPIGEDNDCDHDVYHGMEDVHSRGGQDGYVADPSSSFEGTPTSTPSTEGHSTPSLPTAASDSTVGKAWKFALMPSPPLETSPALIRKFLSTEALTGSSSSNSSSPPSNSHSSPSASGSTSSSSYAGLFVTAPPVAAVSSVQFLAKSRVVVAEAASFIGQQPMSSSASALSVSTTSGSTVDEKEFLAASLLSYETTTTLMEQAGGDDNCNASNLLTRWQQRSPSPLGQYSMAAESSTDVTENDDRSVTPTPSASGRAGSLRTKPSFDTLSSMDRPGTPSSCSSPAQELFSRIMDQNNDHISNNRRHSMGTLVDIMASKARMYLSPSSRNSVDGSSLASPGDNNSGSVRRTASISSSSTLGYSALSNDAGRPHRNSISDIASTTSSTLPPLPPSHHQTNSQTRPHPHQQVVRVSSIESFPRHPSSSSSNLRIQSLRDLFRSSSSSSSSAASVTGAAGAGAGGSNSNSLTSTPNHSRTPTVESALDNNSNAGGPSRRNSLMDLLAPFTSSKQPPPSTQEDDYRSTTSSSSSSTITRRRSETHGSASSSTTSSSPCPSPVLKKLSSRSSLSLVAPPLVVPQIKQSPKLSHATLLSLTSASVADTNDSSSTDGSSSQPNNTNSNGTLRRPKCQVLTTTTSNAGSNKPSPLPSFTVLNEIWMDSNTNTLHQLPGVLLTPSLPFPLHSNTASSTTQPPSTPMFSGGGPTGQGESIEWPWTNMNPTDRDKWPTAFHISAQHGGLLALPPTYSPGSELDEASALSLSRTHSHGLPLDYGSSVMEARRYFGTVGGESVPSSLAGSRVSASGGSLYYDETLGQTPYGNGYYYGGYSQQQPQEQYSQYGPLGPPAATGY
ncbi:hypothetical protein BGZ96_000400 [Linnemannia gamsii]|uniref:Uncharacterized protein n=1 Tax=Linnemannia gamsii TaxID=64522 RepID=A0ABQ7KA12_9FUNG|nr:hypothetical protein BGZ96_000400 [Linnemannia gamsii]